MSAAQGQSSQTVAFVGGLDLVTPPISIPPGRIIAGFNYEPRAEGYRRIEGLERLDGRTKPSEASYSYMAFGSGTAALVAGQVVTGNTSGAGGILLIDGVLLSGSYAGANAVGYLVLKAITGTFQAEENLKVGGLTKAVSTSVANDRGALSDGDDATFLATAVAQARAAIQPVPGGGPVRGAQYFGGSIYAWRDDLTVAPTQGHMYRSTAAGWVLVPLGFTVDFIAGQTAGIEIGDTITGSISGATAVVSNVVLSSGTFVANTGAGRLILSSITGVFATENLTVAGTLRASIALPPTAITLPPGGRYECENVNFYGATSDGAMYACNGVGPAFEWDGSVLTPIITGAEDERPIHLTSHHLHLFLAYRNGSLQASESGLPQGWDGTLGASVFGIGNDIVGLQSQLAGTLAIFSRSAINILSGSSVADFAMAPFTRDAGAIEWTLQTMGDPTFMDDGGVRTMSTTQAFGNFEVDTLTMLIQPLLDAKRLAGIVPVASLRVRTKSHYRLFFSDGTGISIYTGGKSPSTLPFDFGARVPRFTSSGLDADDHELLLMGCDDGYVYQLDKGTSMDGDPLLAFLRPAFNHCGSPNQNKRFQKLLLQVNASPVASIFLTASFSDGDPDQPSVTEQAFDVRGGGGFWDESNWNAFYWSSPVLGKAEAHLDGIGNNFSPTILTTSSTELPHTLSTMTLLFSLRGPIR